jgi:hypothetical protein
MTEHYLRMVLHQAESVLNREKVSFYNGPIIALAEPMLQGVVDFAAAVYSIASSRFGDYNIHKPALALYYHVLKMTDAIEILLSNSCVEGAIPLGRSALEATLSLDFLFQKDYEYRSLAWRYFRLHRNLRTYDPEFQDEETRQFLASCGYCEGPEEQRELEIMRKQIENPEYSELHSRWKSKKPKYWYALLKNGPNSLKDLADLLGKPLLYNTVYRDYSRQIHGDSYPTSKELRKNWGIVDAVERTELLMNSASSKLIKNLLPELSEIFHSFYGEIQEKMNELRRGNQC